MPKRNPAQEEDLSDPALEEGIAQADRGELVAHERVGEWIKSLRTAKPQRAPEEAVGDDFRAETAEGLTELDDGLSVENEEVIRWHGSWGSKSELPMPQPKRKG